MITAKNDVTGDTLKTKTSDQPTFASGWDLIWAKKELLSEDVVVLTDTSEVA